MNIDIEFLKIKECAKKLAAGNELEVYISEAIASQGSSFSWVLKVDKNKLVTFTTNSSLGIFKVQTL